MEPTQNIYPVFEPNQVLANTHLNQSFDYLDEMVRLTRANLIGIGIACGFELGLDTTSGAIKILLSKGCGVTSQGYLIIEADDVILESYRQYTLPDELDYPAFKTTATPAVPYDMWELFPAGEPGTTPLNSPDKFLDGKAVLLFLELKKEGLRNCSPNNCDDKGAAVTVTVRRLLVNVADLDKIIAQASASNSDFNLTDPETTILDRLQLPDVRLPRYDVPAGSPATSNAVFAAFFKALFSLAGNTKSALDAAYDVFKPVLQTAYPANPFANFAGQFGFLDKSPATTAQVRFAQYYYDFFDDLLKAYDEFRWKGAEVLCACCPPEGLFPRHLMLGLVPAAGVDPRLYRHRFLASPAVSNCEDRIAELVQLFRRMVTMVSGFSNTPHLPQVLQKSTTDLQIRITPSRLGDVPLSAKAIPYYYPQDGTPPLFQLWNAEKTRRNRANQNLSYRSDEYVPQAPAFVTDSLRFDLEPYNFLRIEGHLGKNYQQVLSTLLSLKASYRLPIEVIALRTGAFDEDITVDLTTENCRFQDLETLYDTLREELLTSLAEGILDLYGVTDESIKIGASAPKLPLLVKYAPNFIPPNNSLGTWYEKYLKLFQDRPYIDVDQNAVDASAVMLVYCSLFTGTADVLPSRLLPYIVSIYYLMKLSDVLPPSFDALGFTDFENKYQDLVSLVRYFRGVTRKSVPTDLKAFIPQEELIDQFDQVLFSCKLEPMRALHDEYLRRIRVVKQNQFLSFFLQQHPGIQHKAGVPTGGTFIVVYHQEPSVLSKNIDVNDLRSRLSQSSIFASKEKEVDTAALTNALGRISTVEQFVKDPDISFLIGTLTGRVPDFVRVPPVAQVDIIDATVRDIANGTVIADFFLPYLCCSDCPPVQFALPRPPLTLTVTMACTNSDGIAEVTVTPNGGIEPYTSKVDGAAEFVPLNGKLLLAEGQHTLVIQDSAGTQSESRSISVPGTLRIVNETFADDPAGAMYVLSCDAQGGVAPYSSSDTGSISGNIFTSNPAPGGAVITVTITDTAGCTTSRNFTRDVAQPCTLPCDGNALRSGYRFWLPDPDPERAFQSFGVGDVRFLFEFPQKTMVDLSDNVRTILGKTSVDALVKDFNKVVQTWMDQINKLIASKAGSDDWLKLQYVKGSKDPVGVLSIEYFQCLKFEIDIQTSFSRLNAQAKETLLMSYRPEGTVIKNLNVDMPAFNSTGISKCDPARPEKPFCTKVDMGVTISKKIGIGEALLTAKTTGTEKPAKFLWEVQDANPAASTAVSATFKFATAGTKAVRLTAFTDKGCAVTVVTTAIIKEILQ